MRQAPSRTAPRVSVRVLKNRFVFRICFWSSQLLFAICFLIIIALVLFAACLSGTFSATSNASSCLPCPHGSAPVFSDYALSARNVDYSCTFVYSYECTFNPVYGAFATPPLAKLYTCPPPLVFAGDARPNCVLTQRDQWAVFCNSDPNCGGARSCQCVLTPCFV